MSTYKRILGDYTITTVDSLGVEGSGFVTINGNLVVNGKTTSIETTDLSVKDNFVVINDGETGAGVTKDTAGILVDRGTQPNVVLQWNEIVDRWQITYANGTVANISATTGSSTGITKLSDDPTPSLGGNLDVNNYAIIGSSIFMNPTNRTFFQTNVAFKHTSIDINGFSGYVLVAANVSNQGGTGLYVNNSTTTDELVSKTKARKFAIIFG